MCGVLGITLSSLWLRLQTRQPKFSLAIDESSMSFLWRRVIACDASLQFFELPEPRYPLAFFDRFASVDPEQGMTMEQVSIKLISQ